MLRAFCGSSLSFRRSALLLGACRALHTTPRALAPTLASSISKPILGGSVTDLLSTHTTQQSHLTMPATEPTLESPVGSFDLKSRVKLNYTDVTVSKWQSRESGLTVVHLDYDGEYNWGHLFLQHYSSFLLYSESQRPL